MKKKIELSAEIIIIVIVAVIAIVAVIYFSMSNKKETFVYGIAEANSSAPNTLIEDYKSYKRFINQIRVNDEIKIDYKKKSMKERYTEEFFNTKKLAAIVVAEDTSKDYFYDIIDVIYNEDRTQATVKYMYIVGGYAGPLTGGWYKCMMVELDNTVTNVNFVIDNDSLDK